MTYRFLSPRDLTPTEETDPNRVDVVLGQILTAGRWTVPILVEKSALFVMDGHHRLAVALRLGLEAIPAMLLDYRDVRVEAWRADETITPDLIFEMAKSGRKFPIKTTRHTYSGDFPECDVSLDELRHRTVRQPVEISERRAG